MPTPRFLLVLLAACTLASACATGPEERDPEELFELYRESVFFHYQSMDFDRAESQAAKALAIHSDDLECNLFVAYINLIRGQTPDLLAAEKRLRAMDQQDDFRVQLGLGQALERLGTAYDEAAAAIDSGQRTTQASDPQARVEELRAMSTEAWDEAELRFHNVLAIKSKNADAVNGLQRVLALRGNLEGSLFWTNELLRLVEKDLKYYRKRLDRPGISAAEENNQRENMANSSDLAERAYLLGASVLHELNRDVAELEYLTKATELVPEKATSWSRRAQAEMSLDLYDEAIVSLNTFLASSGEAFDSVDVQQAYELIDKCNRALEEAAFAARLESLKQ